MITISVLVPSQWSGRLVAVESAHPKAATTPVGGVWVCMYTVLGCVHTAGSLVMNHGGGSLLQGKPILYGTVSGSIGEGRGKVEWKGNECLYDVYC